MKLGTQTGSLINHLHSNTVYGEDIAVGTPATFLFWTDRKPGTVIKTFEKGAYTYLNVRHDDVQYAEDCSGKYDIVDGNDDNYSIWRFKTDGSSGFQAVTVNPDTGRYNKLDGGGLMLGQREYYQDPHF